MTQSISRRAEAPIQSKLTGAAINVKLIPILLIPPLLLSYHDWRDARKFLLGLSLGVIPFIPVLFIQPAAFYHNALTYGSMVSNWKYRSRSWLTVALVRGLRCSSTSDRRRVRTFSASFDSGYPWPDYVRALVSSSLV